MVYKPPQRVSYIARRRCAPCGRVAELIEYENVFPNEDVYGEQLRFSSSNGLGLCIATEYRDFRI